MSEPLRILIVEDSEDDALLSILQLQRDGCQTHYLRVETAEQMRQALRDENWDVVLCDYSLPHFTAQAALKVLQASELDIPFIIVSGTIGEAAAVEAMRAGAHDYIMKQELARLEPAIRRELGDARHRREKFRAQLALRESERLHRRLAAARQVLLNELDHRIRNNLASLMSLVGMVKKTVTTPAEFSRAIQDRLAAMKFAHDLISRSGWHAVELTTLLRGLAEQFVVRSDCFSRLRIDGPKLCVQPAQVSPLTMIFQELFSNSFKHGALACESGTIALTWSPIDPGVPSQRVRITWQESAEQPMPPPPQRGLGLSLIEGLARFDLGGQCHFDFRPAGLRCQLDCDLEPQPVTIPCKMLDRPDNSLDVC